MMRGLLLLGLAGAQAAASAADMSRPPAVGPVRPYRPPPRLEFKLPNGLEVLLITDRRLPLVSARLALRRGAASLPAEEAGAMDALAELLTEGTRTRTAKQVAEEADAIGGEISAEAGQDFVALRASALSEHAERLLDLLRETALEPTFPEGEVALRRRNMLAELEVLRGEAAFLADVAYNKRLYGAHPYAVTAPTGKSIARIGRGRLLELHRRFFVPNLAVLILAGDIPEGARAAVEKRFEGWEPGEAPPQAPAERPREPERKLCLVDRPGSAQTALRLGNVALTEGHPDYFRLLVLNGVLGGSFASRLVSDIREKRGFAYGIGTRIVTHKRLGAFSLGTQVRTEVTVEALKAIVEHLDRIRGEPVAEEELAQAKSILAGRFVRELETLDGAADQFLRAKIHDLPPDWLETYVSKVQAVTREEALAAAKAHIRPGSLVIAAVGDAARIEKDLSAFGLPLRVNQDGD